MPPVRTCRRHPDQAARWQCGSCRILLCNDCVNRQRLGDMKYYECPTCGGTCHRLKTRSRSSNKPRSFYELLPTAFGYPFTGTGFLVMVFAGLALLVAHMFEMSLVAVLVASLLLAPVPAFMVRVVRNASEGDREMPVFPGLHNVTTSLVKPLLLFLAAGFLWSLTALVFYLVKRSGVQDAEPATSDVVLDTTRLLAMIAGPFFLAHLPVLARLNNAVSLNPLLALAVIARTFMGWLLVSLLFFVSVKLSEALIPILYDSAPSPYLATVATGFIVTYLGITLSYAVGLLYFSKSAKLNFEMEE